MATIRHFPGRDLFLIVENFLPPANAFLAPARAYPEQRKTVGKRAVPASLMGLREIAIKPET